MIKTCELQTCQGNYTVELKDMVYAPDSRTLKKVTGEIILNLDENLSGISKRIELLEETIKNIDSDSFETEVEKEISGIREVLVEIETEFKEINEQFLNLKNDAEGYADTFATIKSVDDLKKSLDNIKSNLESKISGNTSKIKDIYDKIDDINSDITKLKNDVENKYKDFNNKIDDLKDDINKIPNLKNELKLENIKFRNQNGHTKIIFNSDVNYNSDYGYIEYKDDDNDYNIWGDSKENSAIIIGVKNDGQKSSSDVVALKSPAGVFIDAPGLYIKNGSNYSSITKIISESASIKVTYGRLRTQNRYSNSNNAGVDNFSYNYAFVYPPSGYSMDDLIGFMPSISKVYYAGGVNGDDTIYCHWRKESNRIRITSNNSENRANSYVNYIALWRKG